MTSPVVYQRGEEEFQLVLVQDKEGRHQYLPSETCIKEYSLVLQLFCSACNVSKRKSWIIKDHSGGHLDTFSKNQFDRNLTGN